MLEVGGGLGVLSEYLAERTKHVHVVELDRGLEPALRDALDPYPNTTLHFADAVKLDLTTLDPPPNKVVANLPYGVAATVILRTIELPAVETWVAMVQKEVGERFAAGKSTSAYGVPSVLAQLACDVRVIRKVPRGVFAPVPNVDSVLVGLKRHSAAPPDSLKHARPARLRAPPQGARQVALAGPEPLREHPRPHPRGAHRARPPRRRPRRGALARRMARPVGAAVLAPGQGQPLPAGRRAARRRPAPARLGRAADEARGQAHAGTRGGEGGRRRLPRRRGRQPRRPRAAGVPRGDRLGRPAAAADDQQADPDRGRHGRRVERRRRRAAPDLPRLGHRDPAAAADAARRRRHRDALRPARADDRSGRARRGAARRPAAADRRPARRRALRRAGLRASSTRATPRAPPRSSRPPRARSAPASRSRTSTISSPPPAACVPRSTPRWRRCARSG